MVLVLAGCGGGAGGSAGLEPDAAPALAADAAPAPAMPDAQQVPDTVATKWAVTVRRPEGITCTGEMLVVFRRADGSGAGSWTCDESATDAQLRRLYGPAATTPRVQYGGAVTAQLAAGGQVTLMLALAGAASANAAGTMAPPDLVAQVAFAEGAGQLSGALK